MKTTHLKTITALLSSMGMCALFYFLVGVNPDVGSLGQLETPKEVQLVLSIVDELKLP